MAMTNAQFTISHQADTSAPGRYAGDLARQLGFDDARAGAVALIANELATNVAKHARAGELLVRANGGVDAVELLAIDSGPGIANIGLALSDGFSTAGSLGHGLGSVARQASEFDVYTREPGGTIVMARVRRRLSPPIDPGFGFGGVSVALRDEPVCGDDWAVNWRETQGELLVVDGLGHGVGASEAALAATRAFAASRTSSPPEIVNDLHLALRHTRGAALAIAGIDRDLQVIRFAGLGNIGASIVTPELKRINVVSQAGTAGHAARRINEFTYPFRAGSAFVMFSDGLGSGWDPHAYPDLWSYDPAIIAAVLYRDFSRRRDDVTVVAATQARVRRTIPREAVR